MKKKKSKKNQEEFDYTFIELKPEMLKRIINKECPRCGKKMYNVKDNTTGKISPYLWRCKCMPKKMRVSIG